MWWAYEDAAEKKRRLEREIAKRVERGETFTPLPAPTGNKKLCTTFWGQAWCKNLETYQQYAYRLPRGRSYLRQGRVYNLAIEEGSLHAVVAGSELYDAHIAIHALPEEQWKAIVNESTGQVSSMLDLLSGNLGDGLMQVLTHPETGLFPKPAEIRFDCSCPDYADMCKHVSALLYGVGVMLDTQPELLFTLRGVDQAQLLSHGGDAALADLSGSGDLDGTDLSALFGIQLDDSEVHAPPKTAPKKKTQPKPKKPSAKARSPSKTQPPPAKTKKKPTKKPSPRRTD